MSECGEREGRRGREGGRERGERERERVCVYVYVVYRVREALLARGWVELEDKTSTTFFLKWVETNRYIDYRYIRV